MDEEPDGRTNNSIILQRVMEELAARDREWGCLTSSNAIPFTDPWPLCVTSSFKALSFYWYLLGASRL